jgi:type IV pilus assembly protein PilE
LASGFSLLELVIALAMAAVLVAYGVPAYVAYVARGHRIDAVVALHRAAQHVTVNAVDTGAASALPPGLDRTPAHGRAVYRLELAGADDREGSYEIRAIPVDGGPMGGDVCGTFVLDGLGTRSNRTARTEDADSEACWSGRAP